MADQSFLYEPLLLLDCEWLKLQLGKACPFGFVDGLLPRGDAYHVPLGEQYLRDRTRAG